MLSSGQTKKKDIDLMAKNLWHTKALVNIRKHFNYILESYTVIGTQYLPYVEESTRKGERSRPGG